MNKNIALVIAVCFAIALLAYSYTRIFQTKPDVKSVSFECATDDDCKVVGMDCCNNNMPSQNSCMNKNYETAWKAGLWAYCADRACPMFFMMGSYSCSCKDGRCWTDFTSINGNESYTGVTTGQ